MFHVYSESQINGLEIKKTSNSGETSSNPSQKKGKFT